MSKRIWKDGPMPAAKRDLKTIVDSDGYFDDLNDERGEFEHRFSTFDHKSSTNSKPEAGEEANEEDTLDAFMSAMEDSQPIISSHSSISSYTTSNLSSQSSIQGKVNSKAPSRSPSLSSSSHQKNKSKYEEEDERDDVMEKIMEERNKRHKQENAMAKFRKGESIEEIEYDSDDNPIVGNKKMVIESLEALEHNKVAYEPFEKNFYDEDLEVTLQSDSNVADTRRLHHIKVFGNDVARPGVSFKHFGFDAILLKEIKNQGFEKPTPIQMQALPIAMSGRDLIGIASTGSGKTLAFVWPLITHVRGQHELGKHDPGPIAIIVAPTRELASQIYEETRKFSKIFGIRVAPLIGGMGKGDTRQMLRSSHHEIVISTPGRLIGVIKSHLISTFRTTMLVIDEADKLFDLGFEEQLRSIVGQIRPDRQTLLFSATFKPQVESLAREILNDPVRINVGEIGAANEDITQVVEVLRDDDEKWIWLKKRLEDFTLDGSVLIFAGSKAAVEQVCKSIVTDMGITAMAIHGDKTQDERNNTMSDFKKQKFKVLVATDLAARGLDVKSVKTVVNYHPSKDIDSHTHRIGRTGRAGDKHGIAYSLITPQDAHWAGLLLKNLEGANQDIPEELIKLAMTHPKFKASHSRQYSTSHHKSKDFARRQPYQHDSAEHRPNRPQYPPHQYQPPQQHHHSYHNQPHRDHESHRSSDSMRNPPHSLHSIEVKSSMNESEAAKAFFDTFLSPGNDQSTHMQQSHNIQHHQHHNAADKRNISTQIVRQQPELQRNSRNDSSFPIVGPPQPSVLHTSFVKSSETLHTIDTPHQNSKPTQQVSPCDIYNPFG